jgi:anti-sigma factor RsiW
MMDMHLEAELLAFLDGELDERERARVEAHLATCPACAAELERLRALQEELDATFDAALAPVRLPAGADRRIRERLMRRVEPRPWSWWALWQRRGIVAQAILAVLVLVFGLNTTYVLRLPPSAAPQETLVLGQDRLAPGSQAALRVIVRSTDNATPVEGAVVAVRLGRPPGEASLVYSGRTDKAGTANVAFTVPADLEGQASLIVETSSAGGSDRIERPITVAREYKLLLGSDKPAYRPGQTIHLRVLALDAVTFRAAMDRQVTFAVVDATGRELERSAVTTSDFGIAALDFALPAEAAHGQYTLRAQLGDTLSERTVSVGAYELPAFRVTVETGRAFYGAGEQVTGSMHAEYFFGRPVAGGQVTLRGYTGEPRETPAIIVQGQTDAQGDLAFTFVLPPTFGALANQQPVQFDLEVEVADVAGQHAGIRHLIPVAAQPILINAIPESGLLKPGVENVIFILTSYPDGQPAETTLTVTVEGQEHTLTTGPYGLAEFHYTPPGRAVQMDIRACDAQGAEGRIVFAFESERAAQTLLLRAERAAYEVGETLHAEALTTGMDTVYLDVVRTRQTVATLSAPVENGRATFALDLDAAMVGTLELHAYCVLADGSTVQDTRLVVVDAPQRVAVAVSADREIYHPGDTAHIELQTTITPTNRQISGSANQAALGIGVVDESVYALETQPPGFVRAYFLLERELQARQVQGLNVPTLLDAQAEIKAAQDEAARAAWAGVQGTGFTLSAKSAATPAERIPARLTPLANRLGVLLALLPLLLSAVVVQGLHLSGVLGRTLRRVLIGALALFLASPLVALVGGGVMLLLWLALHAGALVLVLVAVAAIWIGLTVYGWARRDTRLQLATGLLAAYLVLGGLLVVLAARGGGLYGLLLILIVAGFLLAVAALAVLGQGLVLEGRRRAGWAATALAFFLVPLVIYLPFVPGLASDLTRALGNPALYAGPAGWLSGCMAATMTPASQPTAAPQATSEAALQVTVAAEATSPPAEALPTEAPGHSCPPRRRRQPRHRPRCPSQP